MRTPEQQAEFEEYVALCTRTEFNPIQFIDEIWGLVPQPVKLEFKEDVERYAKQGQLDKIQAKHFDTFIKGKHITWQQWAIFLAVERAITGRGKNKISVVSGHGIGKDATLSMLTLWYLMTHSDAQIPCTAPTSELMHDVLWKEIKIWLDRMPPKFQKHFDWSSGYIRMTDSPETWFARARTARKEAPEAIAGVHGDYVFIAVDEASGVFEEIYRTAEGSLTGANTLVLLISNGTRTDGYFYDTHHEYKDMWQTLAFSSSESPIVEDDYVDNIIRKYGRDSDEYQIRVAGKFPGTATMDSSGWMSLIEESKIIQIPTGMPFLGKKFLGIDPAGEGHDESVFKLRDEFMEQTVAKEKISTPKTVAKTLSGIINEYELRKSHTAGTYVDGWVDNFGVGADVGKELALMPEHMSINTVNWAEDAEDESVYLNKRSECYFRLRNWLLNGGAVTSDSTKRQVSQIKYRRNQKGKIQIMPKKDLIKLIGKSPDEADALALTFYEDAAIAETGRQVRNNTIHQSQNDGDVHSAI